MQRQPNYLLLALIAAVIYFATRGPADNTGPTVEDMGSGKLLAPVMVGPHAKADAKYFGEVYDALAERLEADGAQDKPIITQRAQLEALFHNAGGLATASKTRGRYPGLTKVVAEFLNRNFETKAGPLTADDRRQAAELLRAIASGFRKAA